MSIFLFTTAPLEIVSQMSGFFRRTFGIKSLVDENISLRYQQTVLRQMNLGVVKTNITKAVKQLIGNHDGFCIVMSRQLPDQMPFSCGFEVYSKAYSLAMSHYPDLVQQLEQEAMNKFCCQQSFDKEIWPATSVPTDIAGRYYLFLLLR